MRGLRRSRPADGPSDAEMSAMTLLHRAGPLSTADLAREERITPQSAGAIVGALVADGLATRTADPDDGRRHLLGLSPAGRRLVAARRTTRVAAFAATLEATFDPEELDRLADAAPLLARLGAAL
jgi:DNA-binding MarR family transcriptional regulator